MIVRVIGATEIVLLCWGSTHETDKFISRQQFAERICSNQFLCASSAQEVAQHEKRVGRFHQPSCPRDMRLSRSPVYFDTPKVTVCILYKEEHLVGIYNV